MELRARPLHPVFAAEITGADAGQPYPALRDAVEAMMDQYAVCVLPGQNIDAHQQVAFARTFGALENPPRVRGSRRAIPWSRSTPTRAGDPC